ncbi:NAD(P)H-hydrate dehydratase [bacterium]|nr:NAD(P)H-hydrate dehydratase [bacterium]
MNNLIPKLPERSPDSHKGTYGITLIIGGSRGMSGAATLCGSAALKSGAGLVQVGSPISIRHEVAIGNPCYTTIGLSEDGEGRFNKDAIQLIFPYIEKAQSVVLGPGTGTTDACKKIAHNLLEIESPVLLDADALNSLASDGFPTSFKNKKVIITPHPGEFSRLTKSSTQDIQKNRNSHAINFAIKHGVIVVLKGHGTIVTNGKNTYINSTGNPGMATGGSGDILSGIIGALMGQGIEPYDAAILGVYLHGLAGDIAKLKLGEYSLTALDILKYLPSAFLVHGKKLD